MAAAATVGLYEWAVSILGRPPVSTAVARTLKLAAAATVSVLVAVMVARLGKTVCLEVCAVAAIAATSIVCLFRRPPARVTEQFRRTVFAASNVIFVAGYVCAAVAA